MLVQPNRTSTRVLVLAAVLVAAMVTGLALQTITADRPASGVAVLEIDGMTYEFEPTTCTVTDSDFLTAGAGEIDGEDFWVSASPYVTGLTLGTSEPPGQSDGFEGDDIWLRSIGEVHWSHSGDVIEADFTMQDERHLDAPRLRGHLTVTCTEA